MWPGTILAAVVGLIALFWRDDLSECSPTILIFHLIAFMASVFAYHAGLAAIVVIPIALLSRRRRLALLAIFTGALCIIPEALPPASNIWRTFGLITIVPPRDSILLFSANLMYGQGDATSLLAQIAREQPDVIVFQEWTHPDDPNSSTGSIHAALTPDYPYSIQAPQSDAFGQAIYSKRPFLESPRIIPTTPPSPTQRWLGFRDPQISCAISVADQTLRITNVHIFPPIGLNAFAEQRRAARAFANWCQTPQGPNVLVGDFNATTRSGIITTLQHAGMRSVHTLAGSWRGRTWPRVGSLRFAPGIRIDHVLVSSGIRVFESRTGEDFGSDHRPVITRIGR